MAEQDPQGVVLRFNEAINSRDLESLAGLMSEDHVFVDSAGQRTRGRAEMRQRWAAFFAAFPDYRNVFRRVLQRADRVVVEGHSVCAEPALSGPAIWTAVVRENFVAEWRVYDDRPDVRRELELEPD